MMGETPLNPNGSRSPIKEYSDLHSNIGKKDSSPKRKMKFISRQQTEKLQETSVVKVSSLNDLLKINSRGTDKGEE